MFAISEDWHGIYINIACWTDGVSCGDFDNDGDVDQADLGIQLAAYGCTGQPGDCAGDADNDGDTDQSDLGILLANYGQPCP